MNRWDGNLVCSIPMLYISDLAREEEISEGWVIKAKAITIKLLEH